MSLRRFSSASLPSVGLFGLIATPDGRYDGAWLTGIGGGENSRGLSLRTGGTGSYAKSSAFLKGKTHLCELKRLPSDLNRRDSQRVKDERFFVH
jgi:hypothetical protein